MRTYNVYEHPTKGYQAIKDGFSWPGFLFAWPWCMVKGLFGVGLGILAVNIILTLVVDSEPILYIATFIIGGIVGLSGNAWRGEKLIKRDYRHVARVTAGNLESAIAEALKGSAHAPAAAA